MNPRTFGLGGTGLKFQQSTQYPWVHGAKISLNPGIYSPWPDLLFSLQLLKEPLQAVWSVWSTIWFKVDLKINPAVNSSNFSQNWPSRIFVKFLTQESGVLDRTGFQLLHRAATATAGCVVDQRAATALQTSTALSLSWWSVSSVSSSPLYHHF